MAVLGVGFHYLLCLVSGFPISFFAHLMIINFMLTDNILNNLIRADGKSVFFRVEIGGSDFCPGGEEGVIYFQRPQSSQWRPLLEIASQVSLYVCVL